MCVPHNPAASQLTVPRLDHHRHNLAHRSPPTGHTSAHQPAKYCSKDDGDDWLALDACAAACDTCDCSDSTTWHKKGKSKKGNKGKTTRVANLQIDPTELAWINSLNTWGVPERCKFWNASVGCTRKNCKFDHRCFLCGSTDHAMCAWHWSNETQCWA